MTEKNVLENEKMFVFKLHEIDYWIELYRKF